MAKHRGHSVESKRQVAQEFLTGKTPHGRTKRHNVSRNLIRNGPAASPSREDAG